MLANVSAPAACVLIDQVSLALTETVCVVSLHALAETSLLPDCR
jgi:hypothetical protein